MEVQEKLPIDIRLIALDETEHWNLDAEDMARIKALGTVYAYDANEHTYACELTPSYCLHPIQPYTDFAEVPENDDSSDEYDEFRDRIDSLQYEYLSSEVIYIHVRTLDRMIAEYNYLDYDANWGEFDRTPEDEDMSEDEWFEEILQGVRENCSL